MDRLHHRLAQIAFDAGDDLGLVLAGGYAISAHRLTERPSRDLDLATASRLPLEEITDRLAEAYRAERLSVAVVESPLMARIEVTVGGQLCEVDLLKEAIGPPVRLDVGPVLALDDAVGLKVGALHDRATHRDFIDDAHFFDYGLTEADVRELRMWAGSWADNLRRRAAIEDVATGSAEDGPDWDTYLEG